MQWLLQPLIASMFFFQIVNIMLFESPDRSFPLPWHIPCAFSHLLFFFLLFSVIHVPPMQQGA